MANEILGFHSITQTRLLPPWKPEPRTRRLWMDVKDECRRIPAAGDYVVTRGKKGFGSAYLIASARAVKRLRRKTPERRFALVVRTGEDLQYVLGCDPWVFEWYNRETRSRPKKSDN